MSRPGTDVASPPSSTIVGAVSSGLATVSTDSPSALSGAPATLECVQSRDGETWVLDARRSTASFRRKSVPAAIYAVLLALVSMGVASLAASSTIVSAVSLAFWVGGPLMYAGWKASRVALDGTHIRMNDKSLAFTGPSVTLFDGGEATFDTASIFAFGLQFSSEGARITVLDRDGEVRAVRCNLREVEHVAFVVARLNEELSRLRAHGHYRR